MAEAFAVPDGAVLTVAEAYVTGTGTGSQAVSLQDTTDDLKAVCAMPGPQAAVSLIPIETATASAEAHISPVDPEAALAVFACEKIKFGYEESQFEFFRGIHVDSIDSSASAADFKSIVVSQLVQQGHLAEGTSMNRVRLRERLDLRAGKVVRESMMWRELNLYANKEYCVQMLDHEENLRSVYDEVLLYVQRWNRSTWSLGERTEVVVKLDTPLSEIGGYWIT